MRDKIIFIFLILAFSSASVIALFLWRKVARFEPEVYYYVPPERSFIYREEELAKFGIEDYLREITETERTKLIGEKKSFVDVNLKEMEISLYKEGEKFKVFPIQAKGAEWFWGKTPPGAYSAGFRARLHFSSVASVWMPYAIQFYGQYFIHGWPYDRAGRPLPLGVSGGCIRLKTEDAVIVFDFAEGGMPILIFDEKITPPLPALSSINKEISPPEINGQSFLVADLDTGEILLSKEADSEIYAGPAVRGMLALTASDSVNLEKRVIARVWMFEGVGEKIIVPGRSYQGYDLLRPLLLQSSKEAALVLSRFLTPDEFVTRMNKKAKGIGMKNTNFEDVTGVSPKNTTTLYDVARMMLYIKDYKNFILDISKELTDPGENGTESIFALLEMKGQDNVLRSIFVGVVDPLDAKKDYENIHFWLDKNFELNSQ